MIDFFTPTEAVTMENFNKRLAVIREALPELNLKIATGSYVGTNTYGAENPNTLSFDFTPSFLLIYPMIGGRHGSLCMVKNITEARAGLGNMSSGQFWGYSINVSFDNDGKTISWYTPSTESSAYVGQMNETGNTYGYFAIGA